MVVDSGNHNILFEPSFFKLGEVSKFSVSILMKCQKNNLDFYSSQSYITNVMISLTSYKGIDERRKLSFIDTFRATLTAIEGSSFTVLDESEWARQYSVTTVSWQSIILEQENASGYNYLVGGEKWYDAYYSISDIVSVNYVIVDETKRENPKKPVIKPKEEKKLSTFASFFVKLKQLKLNVLKSLKRAKRQLHIGEKLDLSFLLKQTHNSVTLNRRDKFVSGTEKIMSV